MRMMTSPDLSEGPHHLQNQWTVWEHVGSKSKGKTAYANYDDNMNELLSFSSVEDFWRWYNNYPKPSALFYDGRSKKLLTRQGDPQGKCIEALSIFKRGIEPKWEDPANKHGAEWCVRRISSGAVLDGYWENLLLGMVGETMDNGDEICGLRVVDKSKSRRDFRIELWLRHQDRVVGNVIRGHAEQIMLDGTQNSMSGINLQWKMHKAY
jgi:hypothetical protein